AAARDNDAPPSSSPGRRSDRRRRPRRTLIRPRIHEEEEPDEPEPLMASRDLAAKAMPDPLEQPQDQTLDEGGEIAEVDETLDDIVPVSLLGAVSVNINALSKPKRPRRQTPDTLPRISPLPNPQPPEVRLSEPPETLRSSSRIRRRTSSSSGEPRVTETLSRAFVSDTMRLAAVTAEADPNAISVDEGLLEDDLPNAFKLALLGPSGEITRAVALPVGRFFIGRTHGDLLMSGDPTVSPFSADQARRPVPPLR
ncbi:MAG: hypothetical protein AAFX99_32020, partial [Myxococcota bacterium]